MLVDGREGDHGKTLAAQQREVGSADTELGFPTQYGAISGCLVGGLT